MGALQESLLVQRDGCRKFGAATNIRSCRNPKHSRDAPVEFPMPGSPSHRSPISEGAHPNPDDCRTKRARTVQQSVVVAAPLNSGSPPTHKAEKEPRDLSRAPGKTRQLHAAVRRIVIAGPNFAHQQRATRTVLRATRHRDLDAERG